MNLRMLWLGYFSVLLGVSPASATKEFMLHDPGLSADIKMRCDATHYGSGSSQASRSFKLHLHVFFEERYALLSGGTEQNDVRMDLTSVVSTAKNPQKYLVLIRESATVVVDLEQHVVVVSKISSEQIGDHNIYGRNCRADP